MSSEMLYPAKFVAENEGGYSVSFPDFPHSFTCGDNFEEAEEMAADCLAETLAGCIADREEIPTPSKGKHLIAVPTWIAAKALLYRAMREQKVTNVALAKRMNVSENVIRQLLDPKRHGSSLALFDQAFRALRTPLTVSVSKRPLVRRTASSETKRKVSTRIS